MIQKLADAGHASLATETATILLLHAIRSDAPNLRLPFDASIAIWTAIHFREDMLFEGLHRMFVWINILDTGLLVLLLYACRFLI